MSKTENEIVENARLITASNNAISDDERILKLITVLLAAKLKGKDVSTQALTRMFKRMSTEPTDSEMEEAQENAEKAFQLLKNQKKEETIAWNKSQGKIVGNKYPEILYLKSLTEDGEEIIIDINHREVRKYIIENLHTVSFNDTLYVYGNDGIYREDIHEVSDIVVDILYDRLLRQKEAASVRDITIALKGKNRHTEYPFDMPGDVFLVENGAVRISAGEVRLLPHSHEHMKTVKLPVKYDVKAPTRAVLAMLEEWVFTEDVLILIQILSQSMYQNMYRTTLKRNYLLQGETDAGKSTYIDLITKFFGSAQTGGVPLQDITNDVRFMAARLEGKLINIYDDLKQIPLSGAGKLKALDGRVIHEIERKGKTPYMGVITCPHVFTCNRPPSYPEDLECDLAWWNRWEFVSFPYSFRKDAGYQQRVFTEEFMSGLLNLVIAQMIQIHAAGSLIVSHEDSEVRERWGMLSNPLKMWVNENFIKTEIQHEYDKRKLFEHYTAYVEDTNVPVKKRISSKEDFGRKLPVEGFVTLQVPTPSRPKKSTERIWVFRSKLLWTGKYADVAPNTGELFPNQ